MRRGREGGREGGGRGGGRGKVEWWRESKVRRCDAKSKKEKGSKNANKTIKSYRKPRC